MRRWANCGGGSGEVLSNGWTGGERRPHTAGVGSLLYVLVRFDFFLDATETL